MRDFKSKSATFFVSIAILCGTASGTVAQTPVTKKRAGQNSIVVERQSAAPQVITVVHRISGLKMVRLLMNSGEGLRAVNTVDEAFAMTGDVHTNIIAGLTLDDGHTVAVWLPEAEVEVETAATFASGAPPPLVPLGPTGVGPFRSGLFGRPDITIIERDGKRRDARYVGLDGLTGLSLLRLPERESRTAPLGADAEVSVGQRMHLYFPEPVRELNSGATDSVYVRIGDVEGQVASIVRGVSGEIRRIRIQSSKFTPSNVGGIAVNDAGQTVGIVESIEGGEANVLTAALIRAAAKRVLTRQTSVPRPWLGISGEPIAFTSLEKIVGSGWEFQRAKSLLDKRRGILLNSIAPGSPAALAALQAGDVIVSVNDTDVASTDDFSMLLTEGFGKPVRFEIVRPNTEAIESIVIKLSEARGPFVAPRLFTDPGGARARVGNPLGEHGITTVPLRSSSNPGAAAMNGLLVVDVQTSSAAFAAGLRPGDVIEAVDEQRLANLSSSGKLELTSSRYVLKVLRGKERLVFQVVESKK